MTIQWKKSSTLVDVFCYRGSEDNVLKRLLDSSIKIAPAIFYKYIEKCPLVDTWIVDLAVKVYFRSHTSLIKYDNLHNNLPFTCYVAQTNVLRKVVRNKTAYDTKVWLGFYNKNEKNLKNLDTVRR